VAFDLESPHGGDAVQWTWRNLLRVLDRMPHGVAVVVDFGSVATTDASAVVTGLKWAAGNLIFAVTPCGSTPDHTAVGALTDEVEGTVDTVIEGVGFTVRAHSPAVRTGRYSFHVIATEP
jgi:hypothetical protein